MKRRDHWFGHIHIIIRSDYAARYWGWVWDNHTLDIHFGRTMWTFRRWTK